MKSNVFLDGPKISQTPSVEFESRHLVADGLHRSRRRRSYGLPHFFKDRLNVLGKGPDVFVYRLDLLFVAVGLTSHSSGPSIVGSSVLTCGGSPTMACYPRKWTSSRLILLSCVQFKPCGAPSSLMSLQSFTNSGMRLPATAKGTIRSASP